ncbi:MAG: hypothetical protein N2690_01095 [Rhodocyclaceae bacterium]|nr:hypothetical protein [Rhodocyclaceae bacterium]
MKSPTDKDFDPGFPFGDEVFLSDKPMTDEEFTVFVRSENHEVPIEEVDFADQRGW